MKINNKMLVLPILLLSNSLYADFMMGRPDSINIPNEIKMQWVEAEHLQGTRPEGATRPEGVGRPDNIPEGATRPEGVGRPDNILEGATRPEGVGRPE
jgi:hypothetical protein